MSVIQLLLKDEHRSPVNTKLPDEYHLQTADYSSRQVPKKVGTVIIQTLTSDNKVLETLEKQEYLVFDIDNGVSYVTKEPKNGIIIKLEYRYNYTLNFNARIDFSTENKFLILKGIDFIDSLNKASKIKLWLEEVNESEVHNLPSGIHFDMKEIRELVGYIMVIETYTGKKFIIPDNYIPYIDFLRIQIVSRIVTTKLCLQRPLEIQLMKDEALRLVEAYKENRINENSIVSFSFKDFILGKEVLIENVILNLSCIAPVGNISKLYKMVSSSSDKHIRIRFDGIVERDKDVLIHTWSVLKTDPLSIVRVPDKVIRFLLNSNLDYFVQTVVKVIVIRLHDYLKSNNIDHSYIIDLFEDPEEDWIEVLLLFGIYKDLDFIYQNLESPVYELVDFNLPQEVAEKIMVKLETKSK